MFSVCEVMGVYGICTSLVSKCCSFVSEALLFHLGAAHLPHRGGCPADPENTACWYDQLSQCASY